MKIICSQIYIQFIKLIKLVILIMIIIFNSNKSYFVKINLFINNHQVLLFLMYTVIVQIKKNQQNKLLLNIVKEEKYINNNYKQM
jgi:hypothetical protein